MIEELNAKFVNRNRIDRERCREDSLEDQVNVVLVELSITYQSDVF